MNTYEKIGDYYIFNGDHSRRLYLGSNSIEDYIEDEANQAIRSASAWYKEVHTGKEITFDDVLDYDHDGSKPGNGFVWYGHPSHELDKRENYTFEGGHTFEFERKVTGLATFGNGKRSATYVKEFRSEAWAFVSGKTLEEQKSIEAQVQAHIDEFNRNHPWLVNLSDRLGHVDDEGNPISISEHETRMKAKYGDDVFDKAEAKMKAETDPKILEMVEKCRKNIWS